MADDRLATPLQQAVLATLCFDLPHGAAIAAQVRPEHFDGVYRDFAASILKYRLRYKRPPTVSDVKDLAARSSFGRDNSPLTKQLVPQLLAERAALNAEYAASRVQDFILRQTYKSAIMEAGDRFSQDDDRMLADVEHIFSQALLGRQTTLGAGTFLTDPKALSSLGQQRAEFLPLGIPALDRLGIGPAPKKLLLYLGSKGSGKSWFCVHVGKQALLQRLKVVHITLEMAEEEVVPRYFKALFGIADSPERIARSVFVFDDIIKDKLIDFTTTRVKPRLDLTNPKLRKILRAKMGRWGTRLGGLVVKEFPTSQLTTDQLTAYLDYLEAVEDFIPNVLIVDYPKLMKLSPRDLRVELGHTVEVLRGIAVSRNVALVCPHQSTRAGLGARRVRSNMAGEDISVVQTADIVLAFSRTEAEERLNLGRLSVEHVRGAPGGLMVCLTQCYATGQYVLSSAVQPQVYWDKLKAVAGDGATEDEDNDDA